MDPRLNEILRLVSPQGAAALRDLVVLASTSARSMAYHPSTPEESKALRKTLGEVSNTDLGIFVLRLDAIFGPVRAFFQAESDRRQGRIAEWLYRGMTVDHVADILTITLVRDVTPEPETAHAE